MTKRRWMVVTVHDGIIDIGAEVAMIENGGALVFYVDGQQVYGVGPGFWKDFTAETEE